MLKTIDYEKYENMDKRSLFNTLLKEEKKANELKSKIDMQMSLINYLKSRVKSVIDEPSYTLENSPALKMIRNNFEDLTVQEQNQLRAEVLNECGINANINH